MNCGPRIAVRCDVGADVGVGHMMRCLALSEELCSRGADVVFVCAAETLPWARRRLQAAGVAVVPPVRTAEEHVALLRSLDVDAVVFDSYVLAPEVYTAVRTQGWRTLAFVDGGSRGAVADVLLDQTGGAGQEAVEVPSGTVRLGGADHVVLRDDIRGRRPVRPRVHRQVQQPRVFAFFGGTDAHRSGPVLTDTLIRTRRPFDATVVAPGDEHRESLQRLRPSRGQRLRVIDPVDSVAEPVLSADLVVAAAGSAMWELMCLGAAAAVVQVADNQAPGYGNAVASHAVAGLGTLEDVRSDPHAASALLGRVLGDAGERSRLAKAAWSVVDGQGRSRVVDVLMGE